MLDHEDLKWIASTSTDLNSILQQISRYSDLARRHKGEPNYIDLLGERVELAAKTAQALFDRVTSQIMARTAGTSPPPPAPFDNPFRVLPSPVRPRQGKSAAATDAANAYEKAATTIPADIEVKNPKGNRELILLIEDQAKVARLASDMLTKEGYKVIEVHDGFQALKIYERIGRQIGLVILDFFLPIMDGDTVFDELRALNPDVAVVLSSGFAEQPKVRAMLAQGLRGFIPKPYSPEKLLLQVRSTLDAPQAAAR
jgi:CheY-like chemotaxis protein